MPNNIADDKEGSAQSFLRQMPSFRSHSKIKQMRNGKYKNINKELFTLLLAGVDDCVFKLATEG